MFPAWRPCWAGVVIRTWWPLVLDETVEAVRETLDQCVNVQLMSVIDGTEYEFRHALTREAVLAQLRPRPTSLRERC